MAEASESVDDETLSEQGVDDMDEDDNSNLSESSNEEFNADDNVNLSELSNEEFNAKMEALFNNNKEDQKLPAQPNTPFDSLSQTLAQAQAQGQGQQQYAYSYPYAAAIPVSTNGANQMWEDPVFDDGVAAPVAAHAAAPDAVAPPPPQPAASLGQAVSLGGKIEASFPRNKHFVCGCAGFKVLDNTEFDEIIDQVYDDNRQEIEKKYKPNGNKKGTISVAPFIREIMDEAEKNQNFMIWTFYASDSNNDKTKKRKTLKDSATNAKKSGSFSESNNDKTKKRKTSEEDGATKPKKSGSFNEENWDQQWFQHITNFAILKSSLASCVKTRFKEKLNLQGPPTTPTLVQTTDCLKKLEELVVEYDKNEPKLTLLHDDLRNYRAEHRGLTPDDWSLDAEDWAKNTYTIRSDDPDNERAKEINAARRYFLNDILYQVADLWSQNDYSEDFAKEILRVFKYRRLEGILRVCLVLDRAHALYRMEPKRNASPAGVDWYSSRHLDQTQSLLWKPSQSELSEWKIIDKSWKTRYPNFKPFMDKCLFWLIFYPGLGLDQEEDFVKWARPAHTPFKAKHKLP